MSKKTLHPSLQKAILNKREENVDGDFYEQAIAALRKTATENRNRCPSRKGL
jgi:hypothetical protein